MVRLMTFLESESCRTLVVALLHTLWQGCIAAGLLCACLRKCAAAATGKRYAASVVAMVAIVLAGLLTWSILNYAPADRAIPSASGHPQASLEAATPTHSPVPFVVTPSGVSRGEGFQPLRHTAVSAVHGVQGRDALATSWQVWAMGVWLVGVVLMLARTGLLLIGESRLRWRCKPLLDERILSLVEQLRQRMRIGRRIAVYISERISVPGVVGCIWPALLLPASAVSGIPIDDLRAMLIHELAHIKRHDYLVNFCQTVIEALLFFNPAVWWISRQIRIEREACCDAAGVALAGPGVKYAEALVAWAAWWRGHLALVPDTRPGRPCDARAGSPRHTRARRPRHDPPPTTLGFAGQGEPGNLLDRIKRLTVAGHRPQLRISWPAGLAMIALSVLCLAGLWKGTNLAVTVAAHILTPQERIDKIAEVSKKYGYENLHGLPEEKVQLSGTVRTWDSSPLVTRVHLMVRVFGRNLASYGSSTSPDGTFYIRIPAGRAYIVASAEGYAPAYAGPLDAASDGTVQGVDLVLGKGFPAGIRLTDESGRPVAGATMTGGYAYPDSGSYNHTIQLTTDANGIAAFDQAPARAIILNISADDFEAQQVKDLTLDANETKTIVLTKAQPATGTVLSKVTGLPIEGAQVHIVSSMTAQGGHGGSYDPRSPTPDAVTDAQGRFALTRLQRDSKYLIFIRSPDYAYRYIPDIQAGQQDIQVALGEKKAIRGKVIGDLSLLPTDPTSGDPVLYVSNGYRYPDFSGYFDPGGRASVTIRDGVGYFEIGDFWGQIVDLTAGDERVVLKVDEDPLDDMVIDLRREMRRQIVLQFQVPADGPPLQGQVRVDYITDRARKQGQGMTPKWLDIQNGRATCEIPVPSQFKYSFDSHNAKRPIGYWFDETRLIDIPPDEASYTIQVPVRPAGAIYGTIFNPDGSRSKNARGALIVAGKPAASNQQSMFASDLAGLLDNGVDRGTFNVTPLPLGGQYAIIGYEGYAFAMSDTFLLNEKKPIVQVDLRLPRGVDVMGRLLDADGTPARCNVAMDVEVRRGEHSWGTSGPGTQSDADGRFVFKNVNPGPDGTCSIRVSVPPGYRPLDQKVDHLRRPVVLRLQKALRVTGTVIDDVTGLPVPGVRVYATAVIKHDDRTASVWEMLYAESETNDQGQFVFSNMARREYNLRVMSVRPAEFANQSQSIVVTGGQSEPVVLRVRIAQGSTLRPRKP